MFFSWWVGRGSKTPVEGVALVWSPGGFLFRKRGGGKCVSVGGLILGWELLEDLGFFLMVYIFSV